MIDLPFALSPNSAIICVTACSLSRKYTLAYEIIVVDNASSDGNTRDAAG
jgi:hypothetical protein